MDHPMTGTTQEPFPPLPLEEWEDTKKTLHRFAQIVEKIRLASVPHANHWWYVTLYVTTMGLTTSPMPYGDITFAIDFDFVARRLVISTSSGAVEALRWKASRSRGSISRCSQRSRGSGSRSP